MPPNKLGALVQLVRVNHQILRWCNPLVLFQGRQGPVVQHRTVAVIATTRVRICSSTSD